MKLKNIFEALRKIGRKIQFIAAQVLLAFLYLVGFGSTKVWLFIFHHKLFRAANNDAETFWLPAQNHDFNPEKSGYQS